MYENILKILGDLNISFDEAEHIATTSCEHSSALRKELGLEGIGSKNIIFHAKGEFYLVTTIATKELKARMFKTQFQTKDIRFATQQEITNINMGTIGSISPFGFINENIKIFVDNEIFKNEYFMFNPGMPTKTIRLKTTDLKKVYQSLKNEVCIFEIENENINFTLINK